MTLSSPLQDDGEMVAPDEGNGAVKDQLQEEPSSESIEDSATEEDSDADDPNDRFHVRTGVGYAAAGHLQAVICCASAAGMFRGESLVAFAHSARPSQARLCPCLVRTGVSPAIEPDCIAVGAHDCLSHLCERAPGTCLCCVIPFFQATAGHPPVLHGPFPGHSLG